MQNDTISVIVPVYNVETYLRKCIDSILAQTYTNLEIILVDDGSPDNCGAICDEYAQKDKRIKVVHKANGGLSDARNAGLDIATGDYIGFVDSDDYIEPDMYESLFDALIRTESDIAFCGVNKVLENGSCTNTGSTDNNEKVYAANDAIRYLLMNDFQVVAWNKLYKSKIFEHIRFPTGKLYEDNITTFKAFSQCGKIVQIGGEKYDYLINRANSITNMPFSDKTFDSFYQRKAVWDFIHNIYSNFDQEADHFLWNPLKSLLDLINRSNNIKVYKGKMDSILREWAWKLNTCKLLTARERLSFLKRYMIYLIKSKI